MTPDQARDLLEQSLRAIVPEADLSGLPGDTDLRERYELDSLDFVEVVERLSQGAGFRVEEDEDLRTIDAIVGLLSRGTPHPV
ncbi:phosphopantetheine-binding protein [Knoellia sp. 3-2P3]|uniref:acyl carrier protein n=1 Tax=unclassified Knoellia TaxID=2618719 RepID=UPI0023DC7444|nr:phosphopantetheine-binding protein [Knoellia sp. 3-2P3]MDF2093486.1 phosphopantetheine-binding protein [Knoellia sp. 3-2P3]